MKSDKVGVDQLRIVFIVTLLQDGFSIAEVSKKLGKTRQAIYDALKRENVDLNELCEQVRA